MRLLAFASAEWSKGFRILFNDKKKNIVIIADSKEFLAEDSTPSSPTINWRKKIFHLFCFLAPLFLVVHCLFFLKGHILADMVSLLTLALFVWSSAALIIKTKRVDLATKQWHSCSHKLIILLNKLIKQNSFQNLTAVNLAKQRRVHWGCAVTIEVFFPLAIFGMYLLCIAVPPQFLGIFPGFYLYFGLFKVILGTLMFFIVLFVLSLLVQFFFWTATPTEEKLEETLRVGKEFLKKYQELTNGSSN